ncbi:MAG TPA: 50S ribosomal protein L35 [Candidatus Dormibacteraeota bacterium]|jgi:large subunit ribosomal protein L35|nr:50S ribosomal protein L35 [Candidatus Dormibacteraeota bacterium]
MPKIRTHKGTAKRFRVTRNGKVLSRHSHQSHILEKKSSKRKRAFSGTREVSAADKKAIRRVAPYL